MQQYVGIYLLQNYSTGLGLHRTHHQEYMKLYLQLLVQVISRIRVTPFLQRATLEEGCYPDT